jgi:hypothetical protein
MSRAALPWMSLLVPGLTLMARLVSYFLTLMDARLQLGEKHRQRFDVQGQISTVMLQTLPKWFKGGRRERFSTGPCSSRANLVSLACERKDAMIVRDSLLMSGLLPYAFAFSFQGQTCSQTAQVERTRLEALGCSLMVFFIAGPPILGLPSRASLSAAT